MAAYAEGLNILHQSPDHEYDLPRITELWRHGSVITSWLLDLTANALRENADLAQFSGHVADSGEGRWTLEAAIEEAVPAPVISAALFSRFQSRGNAGFADRVLSAMRKQFGGHEEKKTAD
jgi:6-phosphogluconate dehydrogenase